MTLPKAITRLLAVSLGATASAYLLAFIAIAAARMAYPFELEWLEGGVLQQVKRVLEGRPLYVAPSLDFIPFLYTPLYFYLGAIFMKIGPAFFGLRLLSTLCALGTHALIYRWIARETGRKLPAWIGTGLFAATFGWSGFWFDLARVDSLFLLLLMAGLFLLDGRSLDGARLPRDGEPWKRLLVAGLLFGLAFAAKQSALPVIACILPMAIVQGWKPALAFLAALAVTIPGFSLAMNAWHGGWFGYYAFGLPARHPLEPAMWLGFWARDILPWLPLPLLLGPAAVTYRLRRGNHSGALFLALASVGMLGTAWLSRLHSGGWDNVLMPAGAWLSLLAGLGLGYLDSGKPKHVGAFPLQTLLHLACLAQFARLAYHPARQIPDKTDREGGIRLVATITAMPGSVYIPEHGYLAERAGKPALAHGMSILDVLRRSPGSLEKDEAAANLEREIIHAMAGKRFASMWLDANALDGVGIFPASVSGKYALSDSFPFTPRQFMTRTGVKTRPAYLFLPSADGPEPKKELMPFTEKAEKL